MTTPPSGIEALLAKGKGAYLAKGYGEALAADRQALALAQESGDRQAQAVCHRFVGLSLYRLGAVADLTASETHLREAIALALNDTRLRLIVSNHLGATLRDLGRHDEAYDLFRGAIRVATGAEIEDVRGRLLGNLGALLDELKQRASDDDCYARYVVRHNAPGPSLRACEPQGIGSETEAARKLMPDHMSSSSWIWSCSARRSLSREIASVMASKSSKEAFSPASLRARPRVNLERVWSAWSSQAPTRWESSREVIREGSSWCRALSMPSWLRSRRPGRGGAGS